MMNAIKNSASLFLIKHGYILNRTGPGYLDPNQVVASARNAGLSICDYLEQGDDNYAKRGRRNRIISKLADFGVFCDCPSVVEIGAGTGMYMEKVIQYAGPSHYQVYETHPGWVKYLKRLYSLSPPPECLFHPADGQTLSATSSGSCSLVHAHAVFVYIPALHTLTYIQEAARVLANGGWFVFDFLDGDAFDADQAHAWLNSKWRFPVLLPRHLVIDFATRAGLSLSGEFSELYGPTSCNYLVFRKAVRTNVIT